MQTHCKKVHSWTNNQKRGGNAKAKSVHTDNKLWITNQACQRFFKQRIWEQYFQVMQIYNQTAPETTNKNKEFLELGDKILEQKMKEVEEHQKKKTIEANGNRYIVNPWLKRAGWATHLAGLHQDQLVAMMQPPNPAEITEEDTNELVLLEACEATTLLIIKAHQCCRPANVGLSALEYVNRRETGQQTNEKPFYAEQKPETIKKYIGRWVKILCWIWRSILGNEEVKFSLTSRQQRCFQNLQHAAREEKIRKTMREDDQEEDQDAEIESFTARFQTQSPDIGMGSRRNSIDSFYQSRPRRNEGSNSKAPHGQTTLEGACLDFWLAMLDHSLKDNEYESGLLSGLAGLGLDTINGGWLSPMNYTPILSALITVSKALVIYKAYQERNEDIRNWKRRGLGELDAKDEAISVIEGVKVMVQKFMTLTTYGGNRTPLNWMLRLRTYGMTIRYNTAEDGRIRWINDEISMGRISFTMSRLRSMVHGLTCSIRND
ncbi:hypothetical protein K3495_g14031, partial [Podosphaera aphanis]